MRATLYISEQQGPRVLTWKSNLLEGSSSRPVQPDNQDDIWAAQRAQELGLAVKEPAPVWADGGYTDAELRPMLNCTFPQGEEPYFAADWREWIKNHESIRIARKACYTEEGEAAGYNEVVRYTDVNGQVRDLVLSSPAEGDMDLVTWVLSREYPTVEGLDDWAQAQGITDLLSWAQTQKDKRAAEFAARREAERADELKRLKKRFNIA